MEGEREGEKHPRERETLISCLSHVPCLGTEPATWACAPNGNRTGDFFVLWDDAQPTEPPTQGYMHNF